MERETEPQGSEQPNAECVECGDPVEFPGDRYCVPCDIATDIDAESFWGGAF